MHYNLSIQLDPQDGLGISSTDMDQLGANSYYEVDEILFDYLNGINENELVEKIFCSYSTQYYQ